VGRDDSAINACTATATSMTRFGLWFLPIIRGFKRRRMRTSWRVKGLEDHIFSVRLFLTGSFERYVHQSPVSFFSLVETLLVVLYSPLSSPFVHLALRHIVVVFVVLPFAIPLLFSFATANATCFHFLFPFLLQGSTPIPDTLFTRIMFFLPGCPPSFYEQTIQYSPHTRDHRISSEKC